MNREEVLNKYKRHCAYCGKEITLKEMQIDHIISKKFFYVKDGHKVNDIQNLNPSCRRCNHYKRAESLENFRSLLKTLNERIMKNYINKVAQDYGIIEIHEWDGLFYYERILK